MLRSTVVVSRAAAPLYRFGRTVLGTAARVYFRRIEVRHAERVPRRGALLVVANHPASFTDVVVLALAIPRHLHFLAMAPIFKPWIRGLALRACGTLPIYRRQDDPGSMHRNEDTFRACHELLDGGGAVLIFPEGTSLTDRQVVRIKTGAARIALEHEARPGQEGRLVLLPVGLHFAERTGFWTEVVVSIGRAIELEPFRQAARVEEAHAVRALTERIQTVLEKLILKVEVDRVALVQAIDEIFRHEIGGKRDAADLGIARRMAECVEHFAHVDPERVRNAAARVRRYQDRLASLRLSDQTLREMLPAEGRIRERARLVALGVLGLVPALAGGLIHYLPYRVCAAAGRATRDPARVAAYRLGAGVVVFPLAYAALAAVLAGPLHRPPPYILAALAVSAALGLHALLYFNWLARQWQRIRLVLLKSSRRRLVARLRRERQAIIRLCETSMRDFLATTDPAPGA